MERQPENGRLHDEFDEWSEILDPVGLIPARAQDVLRAKHLQYKEAMTRVRELEAEVRRLESDRDNWREMFHLRVQLTDVATQAVQQQDRNNQDLRRRNEKLEASLTKAASELESMREERRAAWQAIGDKLRAEFVPDRQHSAQQAAWAAEWLAEADKATAQLAGLG